MQDLELIKAQAVIHYYAVYLHSTVNKCLCKDGEPIMPDGGGWELMLSRLIAKSEQLCELAQFEHEDLEDMLYENVRELVPGLVQYVEWKYSQIIEHIGTCQRLGTDLARFSFQLGSLVGVISHLVGGINNDLDHEYQKHLADEVRKAEQKFRRLYD